MALGEEPFCVAFGKLHSLKMKGGRGRGEARSAAYAVYYSVVIKALSGWLIIMQARQCPYTVQAR